MLNHLSISWAQRVWRNSVSSGVDELDDGRLPKRYGKGQPFNESNRRIGIGAGSLDLLELRF